MNIKLAQITGARSGRCSSWDRTGRNADSWIIPAGETRVLADIRGPGTITHIWMTQSNHYRDCLIRITWDDARFPSVCCPIGDFFGLGHGMVNSYQSQLFTASTGQNNQFEKGCALNCYAPMPFKKRALVELVNQSTENHSQYFYVDYETTALRDLKTLGYFHAEFRRALPFSGWAPEIMVNSPEADAVNVKRQAWCHNYVILETKGKGHYLGCNLSVTNFQGTWWGEGDDMIWVDGYKWPPDLHGTGSEDYLNQAWGMQPNAFLRNGSSIFADNTGGYQTSYVHHLENPVRFKKEIKVTIEHGHANHLGNEMSSVAYWYAEKPAPAVEPPPVEKRRAVRKTETKWVYDKDEACPGSAVAPTAEMTEKKKEWRRLQKMLLENRLGEKFSGFIRSWKVSRLLPPPDIKTVQPVKLMDPLDWKEICSAPGMPWFVNGRARSNGRDGLLYFGNTFTVKEAGIYILHLGHDGGARLFVNGKAVATQPERQNPCSRERTRARVKLNRGRHEIMIAFDADEGNGWGISFSFENAGKGKPVFPSVV